MSFIRILGAFLFTVALTVTAIIGCVSGGFAPGPPLYFAYVVNQGTDTISAYAINSTTGAFTQIPGSPFAVQGNLPLPQPTGIVVDPTNRFLYTANPGHSTISEYSINPATGALTELSGSPLTGNGGNDSVFIHPNGQFLFTADNFANTVSAYSINSTSGALTQIPGSPYTITGVNPSPYDALVDPTGHFLYSANNNTGTISGYSINSVTGSLTQLPGSPYAITGGAATTPYALGVHPTGRFLYVPNYGTNTLSAYTINATTGVLTQISGSPYTITGASPAPYTASFDPMGRFLYIANYGNNTISVYSINSASGMPTEISGSPFAVSGSSPNPGPALVDPTGQFLYSVNFSNSTISAYTINSTTGGLSQIPGSPFAVSGSSPYWATIIKIPQPRFP